MTSNRDQDSAQPTPIYVVYPGRYEGTTNREFQASHLHVPPPKYEDVINGTAAEHRSIPQASSTRNLEPAGMLFVAPTYKQSKMQKTIGGIVSCVFLIFFVAIFIKVLSFS